MKDIKTEIKFLINNFDSFIGKSVFCDGRINSIRKMKEVIFADIFNKGSLVQIKINKNNFDNNLYSGDLVKIFGVCDYAQKGEKTIFVDKLEIINRWKADVPFKHIINLSYQPIKSFNIDKYQKIYLSNLIRNNIRKYFQQNNFFEVQTPILSKKYNGGRSYPVSSSYLNERIGFNRTTMEERMQALIGTGFHNIFQIGSIFRSGEEKTFLEGYSTELDFNYGKKVIIDLLSYVVLGLVEDGLDKNNKTALDLINKNWLEIDFFEGILKYLKLKNDFRYFNNKLVEELIELKIVDNKKITPESLADELANKIFKKISKPLIIKGFPAWSSPLYKRNEEDKLKLQRCRIYIPGQDGGFEVGLQENNFEIFKENIIKQNKIWNLSKGDERQMDSDLKAIISAGLPEILGFALSPDRILKIWLDDPTIDSYK